MGSASNERNSSIHASFKEKESEKVGLKSHMLLRSPKAHDKKLPPLSRAVTTQSLIMVFETKDRQREQPTLSNLQLKHTENKSTQRPAKPQSAGRYERRSEADWEQTSHPQDTTCLEITQARESDLRVSAY